MHNKNNIIKYNLSIFLFLSIILIILLSFVLINLFFYFLSYYASACCNIYSEKTINLVSIEYLSSAFFILSVILIFYIRRDKKNE